MLSTLEAFIKGESISVPYFYSKQLQLELDNFLDEQAIASPTAEHFSRSRHYKSILNSGDT
ncbi:MAG: hypothetical protein H8E09_00410 [Gammaproteobacteria bacterium]|nr:hypothetical protein [Gammaproteobacteria bacterium]